MRIIDSYPGNIGNLSLQHSPESWKYYPNPEPNPKPNPYPFLDPGRVIPGNAGGPGPGRRAGSQNPNPLGGCAPQTPARVSSGRSGVQRHICYRLILLFLIQRHILSTSYFINVVNPVSSPCSKSNTHEIQMKSLRCICLLVKCFVAQACF